MKMSSRIIIVCAVIVGVLFAGKNLIAKFAVEKGVQAATGLPLKIEKFDLDLISTRIEIKNLSLLNPKGFSDRIMFHAPEIFVDYNLGAILKGKIHLSNVRLNFDQFVIVKNEQGQTNLEALKPRAKGKSEQPKRKEPTEKNKKIQIDHLVLKVGKVVYKDYSREGKLAIKEFNVNISEEIHDVMDAQGLLMLIATKAIAKTALTTLLDFNTDFVKGAVGIPKQAVDKLKSTAETLKEKIKLPFGNQ